MRPGTIFLFPLYRLLKSESKVERLLKLDGRDAPGRKYTDECATVIEAARVPDEQGFYLWGRYDTRGLWHNVYLGKAGPGKKAGLRARILTELKNERPFAFRPFLTSERLRAQRKIIHQGRYSAEWERALRKQGSTHIIWVATPLREDRDIRRIEKDLIESMNPTANFQRPAPPQDVWQDDTKEVFGLFREQIHGHRKERFPLRLKPETEQPAGVQAL